MNRADSTFLAVAAGVATFALTVLAAAFLELPMLTYLPRARAWRVLTHAPPGAMSFYGLVLWGVVVGVDAAVLVHALARALRGRVLSRTAGAMATGWVLVSLLLCAGFFVLRNWPRG